MRIALAQIEAVVGEIEGNAERVLAAVRRAAAAGARLVVTPELVLLGYPPRDLLQRRGVVERCEAALRDLAAAIASDARPGRGGRAGDELLAVEGVAPTTAPCAPREVTVLVGLPRRASGGSRPFRNSIAALRGGEVIGSYDKALLPTYDVFDEDRHFEPGSAPLVIEIEAEGELRRVGVLLCEDLWSASDVDVDRRYSRDPVAECIAAGAEWIAVGSASPFVLGKRARHLERLRAVATRFSCTVLSVNAIGANDDLIFDGASCAVGPDGALLADLASFREDFAIVEAGRSAPSGTGAAESGAAAVARVASTAAPAALHAPPAPAAAAGAAVGPPPRTTAPSAAPADDSAEIFHALVLGIGSYFRTCGGGSAVLGISGGIDSAVTAALAVAALGADRVVGLLMPSRHSSHGSVADALELARRLRMGRIATLPIEPMHAAFGPVLDVALASLAPGSAGASGLVDENLQSRIRGTTVMAVANALGAMALATGNKSELAAGYATLYGDMIGALAPLGDLVKRRVWQLARWMNQSAEACGFADPPIPIASIEKPPSAELRPGQLDQDSLPPYDVLDALVESLVDDEATLGEAARRAGCDEATARRVALLLDRSEFKRRQAPIILKVTPRAFGPGRRMPVAMRWSWS